MLLTLPELVAAARESVRCLDAETALAEAQEKGGAVIDVREPPEVSANATLLSVAIPRGVLEMKIAEISTDPGHPIYLHCATGGRATLAAEQLQRLGYTNVTVITCPIDIVCEIQRNTAP